MKQSNLVFSFLCLLAACGMGSEAGLDTSFGTSGMTVIDFNSGSEERAYGVAIDSTFAVFAVGYIRNTTNDFAIAKLTSAGVLDTTFNSTGKSTVDFSGGEDVAYAAAVQTDGKVIAVGNTTSGANTSLAIVRWNANGSLDTGFGTAGKVSLFFGSGASDYRAVVLDSSQRIVVAGKATFSGKSHFLVTRFTTAGVLDTTFGSSGSVSVTPGSVGDSARAIALTSTRIYVAGTELVGAGTTTGNFAVMAYSSDGVLDTSFGTSGIASFDIATAFPATSRDDTVYGMVLDPNSKIAVSGTSNDGTTTKFATVLFATNGTVDTSFGTSGASLVQVSQKSGTTTTTMDVTGNVINLLSTSFLLVGNAATTTSSVVVAKLTSTGALNTGFNSTGMAFLANSTYLTEANAAAISGTKWVIAGSSFSTSWDFTVFRYSP